MFRLQDVLQDGNSQLKSKQVKARLGTLFTNRSVFTYELVRYVLLYYELLLRSRINTKGLLIGVIIIKTKGGMLLGLLRRTTRGFSSKAKKEDSLIKLELDNLGIAEKGTFA